MTLGYMDQAQRLLFDVTEDIRMRGVRFSFSTSNSFKVKINQGVRFLLTSIRLLRQVVKNSNGQIQEVFSVAHVNSLLVTMSSKTNELLNTTITSYLWLEFWVKRLLKVDAYSVENIS